MPLYIPVRHTLLSRRVTLCGFSRLRRLDKPWWLRASYWLVPAKNRALAQSCAHTREIIYEPGRPNAHARTPTRSRELKVDGLSSSSHLIVSPPRCRSLAVTLSAGIASEMAGVNWICSDRVLDLQRPKKPGE